LVRNRRDALAVPGVQLAWEFERVPDGHYALVDAAEPGDPVAILFRRLVNDLDARLDPEDWTCLGVTSAGPRVGRTLVATNLAQSLAMKEYPVILVDADLRQVADTRPADLFETPPARPGLLQTLRGQAPPAALLCSTETPGLSLITAGRDRSDPTVEPKGSHGAAGGPPYPDAVEPARAEPKQPPAGRPQDHDLSQLGSRQFRSVLDTLRQSGRHLVYDLPPIGTHETVLEAAASLGSVVLVARSGQTTRDQLREAAQLLEDRGTKVCGILVTDVPTDVLEGSPLFPVHGKRRGRRRWFRRNPSLAARDRDVIA
jgi:tyrosine-protein kinase Etk/Wzc